MFRAFPVLGCSLLICITLASGCTSKAARVSDRAAEQMNAFHLMQASATALEVGQTADAAFLYLAGRARFQIDRQVYPPVESGGNSPGVLMSALSATLGPSLAPVLNTNPTASANASTRLGKWTPKFPPSYDPGWKYQNALQGQAAAAVVAAVRKEIKGAVDAKSKLLANPEYAQLNRELTAARATENQYWAERNKDGKVQPVSDELQKKYEQAINQKNAAAKRMREIEWQLVPDSRWHSRLAWDAKKYFDDEAVIALCHAIEADDVPEMKRLIAAGANVNTIGKDGMTPLLWAFPEAKPERFQCLLEHGANPNVTFRSDFGTKGKPFHPYPAGGELFDDRGCHAGQSITHLVCRVPSIEYMELVFAHGGDPNLIDSQTGEAPLDIVLSRHIPDMEKRIELLLAKGSDLNRYCKYKMAYPLMQAIETSRFDVAITLLKAGADPSLYQHDGLRKAVHFLTDKDHDLPYYDSKRTSEYNALIRLLQQKGESLEQARKDEQDWRERLKGPPFGPEGHAIKVQRIIAEREAKEQREN